jgi:hypothetical protein
MFEDFFDELNKEMTIETKNIDLIKNDNDGWDTGEPQKFWINPVDPSEIWKN